MLLFGRQTRLHRTKANKFSYATAEMSGAYGNFLFELFGGTKDIKRYLFVRLEPGVDPVCTKSALIDDHFIIEGTKIKTKRICVADVELDLVLIKIQVRAYRNNPAPAVGAKGANPRKKSGLMVDSAWAKTRLPLCHVYTSLSRVKLLIINHGHRPRPYITVRIATRPDTRSSLLGVVLVAPEHEAVRH